MAFSTQDDRGTKMRDQAVAVHGVMVRDSVVQPDKVILWEGSIAAIFRELNITQGYHTHIMRLLERTDCLRQKRRGSRNVLSQYVLLKDPRTIAEADWPSINSIVKSNSEGLTKASTAHILLEQRTKALEDKLQGLDVARALADLQSQIDQLRIIANKGLNTDGPTENTSGIENAATI